MVKTNYNYWSTTAMEKSTAVKEELIMKIRLIMICPTDVPMENSYDLE
jgi:hypothetical protein